MKNPFLLLSFVLVPAYAIAAIAASLHWIAFSVLSLPNFVAGFASSMLLAIFFQDYATCPGARPARRTRHVHRRAAAAGRPDPAFGLPTWTCHTYSR
ncbi:MAG TPA: hypothetical protein VG734_26900 [Lacunisphaera sp.]|nr:hypothetical protein [Lacunisphaera sp.]